MNFKPLFFAVPLFVFLMVLEYFLTHKRGKQVYHFEETISNLTCGIGHLLFDVFFRLGIFVIYDYFSGFGILNFESSILSVIILFILIDFIYYWYHRISHEVGIFWAIHSVHHQSEYFNFSVGLRQAWLHKVSAFWIYIPPAFLGFSSQDYLIVASLHAVMQIWTHTEMYAPKLGVLKYLLVTPDHHKLHHGKNKVYLNKNYSGILSLWDYLFGTVVSKTEEVIYGVNDLKVTYNPFEANWKRFSREVKSLVFRKRFQDQTDLTRSSNPFFSKKLTFRILSLIKLFCSILLTGFFLGEFAFFNILQVFAGFSFILLSLSSLGILLDKRESFIYWEGLSIAYAILVMTLFPAQDIFTDLVLLNLLVGIITLFFIYKEFVLLKFYSFKTQS